MTYLTELNRARHLAGLQPLSEAQQAAFIVEQDGAEEDDGNRTHNLNGTEEHKRITAAGWKHDKEESAKAHQRFFKDRNKSDMHTRAAGYKRTKDGKTETLHVHPDNLEMHHSSSDGSSTQVNYQERQGSPRANHDKYASVIK